MPGERGAVRANARGHGQGVQADAPAPIARERPHPVAWLYIAAVVAMAVVLVLPVPPGDQDVRWWFVLGVLQLLFLICDSTPTPLASRQSAWSPSSSATLAAVVLLGPAGAALVGAISVFSLRRHLILAERLFNGAMYAVSGYAAGSAYVALGGPVGRLLPQHSPRRRSGRSPWPRPCTWSPIRGCSGGRSS